VEKQNADMRRYGDGVLHSPKSGLPKASYRALAWTSGMGDGAAWTC
jgi:hypothetical protein